MSNMDPTAQSGWKRTAMHSALAVAFTNLAFVAPAVAVCPVTTATISTAVGPQTPCPGDTVTVTSTGSATSTAGNPAAGFLYGADLAGRLTNDGAIYGGGAVCHGRMA